MTAYAQAFRSGAIETVSCASLVADKRWIPSIAFEEDLIKSLADYMRFYTGIGINPPIFAYVSLLSVKGYSMSVAPRYNWLHEIPPIDKDDLILPGLVINSVNDSYSTVLRPSFDFVWQSCGFLKSLNYDEDGNWAKDRQR
jgi:hypothetical protein